MDPTNTEDKVTVTTAGDKDDEKQKDKSGSVEKNNISFVDEALSTNERSDLALEVESFIVQHATHHRPIALVSSGGTAADMEQTSVRSIENFSSGLRGAISVEEFLKRGYAVIHLWRTGSASPFARVLSHRIGLQQANYGLSTDSLGKLFACGYAEDSDDWLVQQVLKEEQQQIDDPWLTEPTRKRAGASSAAKATEHLTKSSSKTATSSSSTSNIDANLAMDSGDDGLLTLHRHLHHSTKLRRALRERKSALEGGLLLTVPFRTVEQYIAKLEFCSKALRDCHSLAIFYLTAAVSDFYIPKEYRAQHKIQSGSTTTTTTNRDGADQKSKNHENDNNNKHNTLLLQLHPVPKTLGLLRQVWAPDAFVVSFKLETDKTILRQKAERAVQKYGCHMVIGNILQTRYEKVWVLQPPNELRYNNSSSMVPVKEWTFHEISRSSASSSKDDLEDVLLDHIIQCHFEYISWHRYHDGTVSMPEQSMRTHEAIQERKRKVEQQVFWKQMKRHGITIAGSILSVVISYTINSILQKRVGRR